MLTIENHIKTDEDYDRNKPAIKFRDATAIRRFWGLRAENHRVPATVRGLFSRQHDLMVWSRWDPVIGRSHPPTEPGHVTWEGKVFQEVYRAAKASEVLLGPDSYDPKVVDWSEITQRAYTIVWANGYEDGERQTPRVPLYMDKLYSPDMWKLTAPEMSRPAISFQWWRNAMSNESSQPPPSYANLFPTSGPSVEQ